jgi:hypothetical protein
VADQIDEDAFTVQIRSVPVAWNAVILEDGDEVIPELCQEFVPFSRQSEVGAEFVDHGSSFLRVGMLLIGRDSSIRPAE